MLASKIFSYFPPSFNPYPKDAQALEDQFKLIIDSDSHWEKFYSTMKKNANKIDLKLCKNFTCDNAFVSLNDIKECKDCGHKYCDKCIMKCDSCGGFICGICKIDYIRKEGHTSESINVCRSCSGN